MARETVHSQDILSPHGELRRSPLLDAPSGQPLRLVPARPRAIFVLLAAGEVPALVGRLAQPVPPVARRAARALAIQAWVARETGQAPTLRAGIARLHAVLPDQRLRWPFLLRASGLFHMTELPAILRVHRATCYRRLDAATARLTVAARNANRLVGRLSPRRTPFA